MSKPNRNETIRNLLRTAPSTIEELATLAGISHRSTQVGLWVLRNLGHVRNSHRTILSDDGASISLYELTEKGRRYKRPCRPPNWVRQKSAPRDWRSDRAQYLIETGRIEQVKTEGLEYFLPARAAAYGRRESCVRGAYEHD